jgi:NMD protein affecting ribosome stability and mRNA decay
VTDDERTRFPCPRCGREVEERFYGPCAGCCTELRATLQSAARTVEARAFEPKMNVVPNQVATKE